MIITIRTKYHNACNIFDNDNARDRFMVDKRIFNISKVYLLSICFELTQIYVRSLKLLFPGFVISALLSVIH